MTPMPWVVLGLVVALAATRPIPPTAFRRRSSEGAGRVNLTEPWTEAAKRDEYRRATWRRLVLDEVGRYDDDPLTVLACRQPAPRTPEAKGHRDAEDAHRRNWRIP